jgi:CCR4-NOT transcriptional regulation complex NOT5 subunit
MEITRAWADPALFRQPITYYINGRRADDQAEAKRLYDEAGPEATVRQEPTCQTTGCGSSTRKVQ